MESLFRSETIKFHAFMVIREGKSTLRQSTFIQILMCHNTRASHKRESYLDMTIAMSRYFMIGLCIESSTQQSTLRNGVLKLKAYLLQVQPNEPMLTKYLSIDSIKCSGCYIDLS